MSSFQVFSSVLVVRQIGCFERSANSSTLVDPFGPRIWLKDSLIRGFPPFDPNSLCLYLADEKARLHFVVDGVAASVNDVASLTARTCPAWRIVCKQPRSRMRVLPPSADLSRLIYSGYCKSVVWNTWKNKPSTPNFHVSTGASLSAGRMYSSRREE